MQHGDQWPVSATNQRSPCCESDMPSARAAKRGLGFALRRKFSVSAKASIGSSTSSVANQGGHFSTTDIFSIKNVPSSSPSMKPIRLLFETTSRAVKVNV